MARLFHLEQVKAWDRHHTTPAMIIAMYSITAKLNPIFTFTQYLHYFLMKDFQAIENHWERVYFQRD